MDAKFGWMFVQSFLESTENFPVDVTEPVLQRAYSLLHYGTRDPEIEMAIMIDRGPSKVMRNLLRCFLIDRKYGVDQIAYALCLRPMAVAAYNDLFFNIRGRRNDTAYVIHQVYPETRQVEMVQDYQLIEDPGMQMLRAAYNGNLQVAVNWGGVNVATGVASVEGAAVQVESMIMKGGLNALRLGFGHQQNIPAINHARQVLQASKIGGADTTDDDWISGLGAMSMHQSLKDEFIKATRSDVQRRLELERQFGSETTTLPQVETVQT